MGARFDPRLARQLREPFPACILPCLHIVLSLVQSRSLVSMKRHERPTCDIVFAPECNFHIPGLPQYQPMMITILCLCVGGLSFPFRTPPVTVVFISACFGTSPRFLYHTMSTRPEHVVVSSNDKGPVVNVVGWLCCVASASMVATKLITKYTKYKTLHRDDWYSALALVRNTCSRL